MKLVLSALTVAGLAGLFASASHPAAPAPARAAESYTVDAVHSAVLFHTLHMGISRADGRFDKISGAKSEVTFDKDITKSSLLLVIDAASVNTNDPKRDEHVRSADFFSAKEFPEIVFESKKITGTEKAFEITGDLTFHGVTKPVTAKGSKVGEGDAFGGHRIGFTAELKVNMADFALEFLKKNAGAVGPEVTLTISLECVRK